MTRNPIVYVAHPYGGDEVNRFAVDRIMTNLVLMDKNHTYVSPIHNYSMLYFDTEYAKGLEICLDLLKECDYLVLCGNWEHSKGCIGEWAYAKAAGIRTFTWSEWTDLIKQQWDCSR